jgi:hypothetical protein
MNRTVRHLDQSTSPSTVRIVLLVASILLCGVAPRRASAEPTAAALADYDTYVRGLEIRLARQHKAEAGFIVGVDEASGAMRERLRDGEFVVEPLASDVPSLPGAMLSHWRAMAFVAGARGSEFERVMRDFARYPKMFAPEVLAAKVLEQSSDHMTMTMRVRQRHVITVVMDTAYDVDFFQLDAAHGYSASRSTQISEIAYARTRYEHPLGADEEHGFLWRQNTYWSYAERDGGLYLQVESVSLSRAIPHGLAWAVGPFVMSVPRESLEFTLRSVAKAMRR